MHLGSLCIASGADFMLLRGRPHDAQSCVCRWSPSPPCGPVPERARRRATYRTSSSSLGKKVVGDPPPHALRRPRRAGVPAICDVRRSRHRKVHDRGEGGVRAHIDNGFVVYAGIDYGRILQRAQDEAEVILWDGGSNDLPFYVPRFHICIADPHQRRARDRVPPWRGELPARRRHRGQQVSTPPSGRHIASVESRGRPG